MCSLLERYRRAAGLTQEALTERTGASARGIQDLEPGLSRMPRPYTIDSGGRLGEDRPGRGDGLA
ncbi:MAG: helix-turn-helix domain-containing protein [Chloroflexi bacterium]|nr:helix-turn-helix domain-containing protein [Chloroflexota bacterium]